MEDLLQTRNYNDPEEVFSSIDFGCYGKQQAYSCMWKRPLFSIFRIDTISINSFLFCCRTERKKTTSDRDVAFQSVVSGWGPNHRPIPSPSPRCPTILNNLPNNLSNNCLIHQNPNYFPTCLKHISIFRTNFTCNTINI